MSVSGVVTSRNDTCPEYPERTPSVTDEEVEGVSKGLSCGHRTNTLVEYQKAILEGVIASYFGFFLNSSSLGTQARTFVPLLGVESI